MHLVIVLSVGLLALALTVFDVGYAASRARLLGLRWRIRWTERRIRSLDRRILRRSMR